MIEITLKLDTEAVEQAVRSAWQQEFRGPSDFGRQVSGKGWDEALLQVRKYIETLDLADMIAKVARDQLEDVVTEVVKDALRSKAKKLAKSMERDGTLL